MDFKPVPIAAALVGGGAVALVAGSAAVAKVSPFAPAGLGVVAGIAALAIAKSGNSEALRAFGYASLGIGALLGYSGYQAYSATKQTTAGNLRRNVTGADLHTIVGYWIQQNVAPPSVGGLNGFARSQQENDMSGQRQPAAWAGRKVP